MSYLSRPAITEPRGSVPAPSELELVVYVQRTRLEYPLPARGSVRIGRGPDNDIRIAHRSVSRQHLLLHLGARVELEDLPTSVGSWFFPGTVPADADDETLRGLEHEKLVPGVRVAFHVGDMVRTGVALLSLQRRASVPCVAERGRYERGTDGLPVLVDASMRRLYAITEREAASEQALLLLGEPGVGKKTLAEFVHRSSRCAGELAHLDCSALPEPLLERELFGAEQRVGHAGPSARPGCLERAASGTLVLAEVDALPLRAQIRLLRSLERDEARGPRLIATSSQDLDAAVTRRAFRAELLGFLTQGAVVEIPPLRLRPSDILPLARYFLRLAAKARACQEPELLPEAEEALLAHPWPGNVAELRQAMDQLPAATRSGTMAATPRLMRWQREKDESERERIAQALDACGGNQTRAAELLGVSRRTLINRLNEYGLPRPRRDR